MAYSTQVDLEKRISPAELAQMTDDTGGGTIDPAKIDEAIADADSEIDGYCADRYSVPFSPVPDLVRRISAELAIHILASRRGKMTEVVQNKRTAAVGLLKSISKGDVTLGTATQAVEVPDEAPEFESNDRLFSRDTMDGF